MERLSHDRRTSLRISSGLRRSGIGVFDHSMDGAIMRNRTDDLIDMSVSIAAVLFVIMLALVMLSLVK